MGQWLFGNVHGGIRVQYSGHRAGSLVLAWCFDWSNSVAVVAHGYCARSSNIAVEIRASGCAVKWSGCVRGGRFQNDREQKTGKYTSRP